MSHIRDRLKQYKDKYSDCYKYAGLYAKVIQDMIEQLQGDLEQGEKENGWIPVSERLPKERDSMFAKFKGTSKWKKGMFEKVSRNVIVTVKYDNGECRTNVAHTVDGRWKLEIRILNAEVIAWKEMPEPYKEDKS